jgi:type II secretory pathway component PulC
MKVRAAVVIYSLAWLSLLACDRGVASKPAGAVEHGAAPTTAPPSSCAQDAIESVRKLSPTHCQAPKAAVFGDDDCLLSRPQLAPVTEAGRVIGFRHDSIPSRSVYARCGIRSGDIWTQVNGVALDSPDQALELYPRLRASEQLSIALLRDGRPVQVHIELQ